MQAKIYINNEQIGTANFQIADESMGAINGVFVPNENYQKYKSKIQLLTKLKGIANSSDFNFRIIINDKLTLNPEGGIGITDCKVTKELIVESAGSEQQIIEKMKITNNYFNQQSERLTYRALTKEDIPSWIPFFHDNDRLHFLGMDLTKPKEELAAGWIMAQFDRYEKHGLGHLAVQVKGEKGLIGLCGIIPREVDGKNEFEIAYSLIPKYWGKGYGTEMAQQMKAYGTRNIKTDRFVSIIEVNNADSIKVAKKNGMQMLFETKFLGMEVQVFGIEK